MKRNIWKRLKNNLVALDIMMVVFIFGLSLSCFVLSVNTLIPSRDSGAFLYGGNQLLLGRVPYLDFWDHKPPLVYVINAVSLIISKGELWGLWMVEILFCFLSLLFLWLILKKTTNRWFSWLGIILFFISYSQLLEGGNRVEEFGVLFQLIVAWLSIKTIIEKKVSNISYLGIGIITGILFLLKPNIIGVYLVWTAVFFLKNIKNKSFAIKKILVSILGFGAIFLLTIFLITVRGALGEFIDQVFVFNAVYAKTDLQHRLLAVGEAYRLIYPLSLIIFPGVVLLVISIWSKRNWFLIFCLLWLVVELMASLVSGRSYRQYFLPLIAPMVLVVVYSLKSVNKLLVMGLLAVILVVYFPISKKIFREFDERKPIDRNLSIRGYLYNNFREHQDTLEAIEKYSDTKDKILIWGSEPSMLFLSKRQSIDKYYYQFRLFLPGYKNGKKRISELTDNLIATRPKIIIDASLSTRDLFFNGHPQMPPLNKKAYSEWLPGSGSDINPKILEIIGFVEKNYVLKEKNYNNTWSVYVLKEK